MRQRERTLLLGGILAGIPPLGCYSGLAVDVGPADTDSAGTVGSSGGSAVDPSEDGDESSGEDTGAPPMEDCVGAGTPLRRLTVREYDNTVRQLLGESVGTPGNDFLPSDMVDEGFDNAVKEQGSSPLLARGYLEAAEQMAADAEVASLVSCDLASGDETCAREFIETFGLQAYRRPLEASEVEELMGLWRSVNDEFGFEQAIRTTLQLFLSSPNFLYRVERSDAEPGSGGPISDYETATRLSYTLWGTMPDETLFEAASRGELSTKAQVAAQAERMLEHSNARRSFAHFSRQWLEMADRDELWREEGAFPGWSNDLIEAMDAEVITFMERLFFDDAGTFEELMTSTYSYMSPELADYRGLPEPDENLRVELDPTRYAGLLTMAGPLAASSQAEQPHPTYRGKWVQHNFLCNELSLPEGEMIEPLPDEEPGSEADWRERLAAHLEPDCATCHALMDPIGFGMLQFDPTGKWTEGDIDASGSLIGAGPELDGEFDGAAELAHRLGESENAARCLSKQLFRFTRGREEQNADTCAVDQAYAQHAEADGDLRTMLLAVTQSDDFLYFQAADLPEETEE